jgi:hypothetical protein
MFIGVDDYQSHFPDLRKLIHERTSPSGKAQSLYPSRTASVRLAVGGKKEVLFTLNLKWFKR